MEGWGKKRSKLETKRRHKAGRKIEREQNEGKRQKRDRTIETQEEMEGGGQDGRGVEEKERDSHCEENRMRT